MERVVLICTYCHQLLGLQSYQRPHNSIQLMCVTHGIFFASALQTHSNMGKARSTRSKTVQVEPQRESKRNATNHIGMYEWHHHICPKLRWNTTLQVGTQHPFPCVARLKDSMQQKWKKKGGNPTQSGLKHSRLYRQMTRKRNQDALN